MNIIIPSQYDTFRANWGSGVTERYNNQFTYNTYQAAIKHYGATPVLMTLSKFRETNVQDVHGILLPGGCDIDPSTYNCPREIFTQFTDDKRDHLELKFAEEAIRFNIPVLGICRGMQILHIAGGGQLYQDISACREKGKPEINHYKPHNIKIEEHDLLRTILATGALTVNSTHHQCIAGKPLYPFKAGAWSDDGICEAMYSVTHWFAFGVQWHPERFTTKQDGRLIRAFVKAAERKQEEMECEIS